MPCVARLPMSSPAPAEVTLRLLGWFGMAARDLPWRHTLDPYAVWVSEVMLQQTQVRTVLPYWTRWMRELPDVQALADAPLERVLKLWEGLGYYRRVRNLHRAARQVVDGLGGQLPRNAEGWLALPGVGPYTAGAIASIAFNQPEPILDGNVTRVLCRLLAMAADTAKSSVQADLWEHARRLVEAAVGHGMHPVLGHAPLVRLSGPCSALNQSLMELGATVCTPVEPACRDCPLASLCRAHALGRPGDFPRPPRRLATTKVTLAAVVWDHGGRFLVRCRPEGAVNAGLWEFPSTECHPRGNPRETLAAWLGVDASCLVPAGTIRHAITRYRMEQHVFRLSGAFLGANVPVGCEWRPRPGLVDLAWTSAHRRALALLDDGRNPLPRTPDPTS